MSISIDVKKWKNQNIVGFQKEEIEMDKRCCKNIKFLV